MNAAYSDEPPKLLLFRRVTSKHGGGNDEYNSQRKHKHKHVRVTEDVSTAPPPPLIEKASAVTKPAVPLTTAAIRQTTSPQQFIAIKEAVGQQQAATKEKKPVAATAPSAAQVLHAGKRSGAAKTQFFKENIRLLPQMPGVYKMLAADKTIIYIGKAKNLRNRVASYFHAYQTRLVTQLLVTRIHAVDYVVTITEKDALILENTLIKRHQPFFNIDLKDKKSYPYLWLTTHERYPRLVKTRELTKQGTYFGPYTDVKQINVYVDVINSLFPLKKCRQTRFPQGFQPCLYYHIGKCLDYCTGNVSQTRLDNLYQEIKSLLKGDLQEVIANLEAKMHIASKKLHYERALALRNACATLKSLDSKQTVSTLHDDDFDVFHYNLSAGWLLISLLMFRNGRLIDKEVFQFKSELWAQAKEAVAEDTQSPLAASIRPQGLSLATEVENDASPLPPPSVAPAAEAANENLAMTMEGSEENIDPFQMAATLPFLVEAFSQFIFEYYQQARDPIAYIILPENLLAAQGARSMLTSAIAEALQLSASRHTSDIAMVENGVPAPPLPPTTLTRGKQGGTSSSTPSVQAAPAVARSTASPLAIKVPQLVTALKGAKKRVLRLAKANADQSFYNLLAQHEKRLRWKRLKDLLNLEKIPKIVDVFDVANTADQSLVAACVRFVEGIPDKQQYRLFNIRSTRQQNDFLSIAEAVFRRYHRLTTEKTAPLPDMIVIDGGRGQLNAAHASLARLKLTKIVLISLAKQEELILTRAHTTPLRLAKNDEALRYLVHVRDEVHRFVNRHHRHHRSRAMLKSSFSNIAGLGPKKIKTLLTHFDSLEELKLASRDRVTRLPYIGDKDYDLLVTFFKQHTDTLISPPPAAADFIQPPIPPRAPKKNIAKRTTSIFQVKKQ